MPSVIEKARVTLERRGEGIGLLRHPFRTMSLFGRYTARGVGYYVARTFRNRLVTLVLLPLIVLLVTLSYAVVPSSVETTFAALDRDGDGYVGEADMEFYYAHVLGQPAGFGRSAAATWNSPALSREAFVLWWAAGGPHDAFRQDTFLAHGLWREVEYIFADAVYWVVLGILSSVGLGTGMHSGLLFLFPHIYRVCAAVEKCGGADFYTYPVNFFYGPKERAFVCFASGSTAIAVPLWRYWAKVASACVLWGAGTAMGEVPPYALSYAAALQSKNKAKPRADAGSEEASSEARTRCDGGKFNLMTVLNGWMLQKIKRYGFWAILLLAAWPNMAFDLCGMACGQFLMPFWTFFSATFIGKALIKVNLQAVFFIFLFSGDNMERLVLRLGSTAARFAPSLLDVSVVTAKAVETVVHARESIANHARGTANAAAEQDGEESLLVAAMGWLVTVAVTWFAKSIMESFALSQVEEENEMIVQQLEVQLAELGKTLPEEPNEKELTQQLNASIHHVTGCYPTGSSASRSLFCAAVAVSLVSVVLGWLWREGV